jgi:hypothetical protein
MPRSKNSMHRRGLILIACLLGAAGTAGLHAQTEGPDQPSGHKMIHSVLILPAMVNIVKSGMKGNDPLVEESHSVEQALSPVVGSVLTDKGCEVLPDVFTAENLEKNPDLKYALADLQSRYDKVEGEMNRKLKDIGKGRYTLGDDVANFSPGAGADALIFVRGQGEVTTGGKKAFSMITGVGNAVNAVGVRIAVVDAQSGEVLYYAISVTTGNFIGEPERMKKPIESTFKKFQNPKNKK